MKIGLSFFGELFSPITDHLVEFVGQRLVVFEDGTVLFSSIEPPPNATVRLVAIRGGHVGRPTAALSFSVGETRARFVDGRCVLRDHTSLWIAMGMKLRTVGTMVRRDDALLPERTAASHVIRTSVQTTPR